MSTRQIQSNTLQMRPQNAINGGSRRPPGFENDPSVPDEEESSTQMALRRMAFESDDALARAAIRPPASENGRVLGDDILPNEIIEDIHQRNRPEVYVSQIIDEPFKMDRFVDVFSQKDPYGHGSTVAGWQLTLGVTWHPETMFRGTQNALMVFEIKDGTAKGCVRNVQVPEKGGLEHRFMASVLWHWSRQHHVERIVPADADVCAKVWFGGIELQDASVFDMINEEIRAHEPAAFTLRECIESRWLPCEFPFAAQGLEMVSIFVNNDRAEHVSVAVDKHGGHVLLPNAKVGLHAIAMVISHLLIHGIGPDDDLDVMREGRMDDDACNSLKSIMRNVSRSGGGSVRNLRFGVVEMVAIAATLVASFALSTGPGWP